jgi:tetratricopeptide (TPR) repeat protein
MNPGRNELCPCGSGKKYKRCCAMMPAASRQEMPDPREIGILVALIDQSRFGEAEQGARTLLARHPDAGMPWKLLSVALLRQGKEALQALRRTAELLPNDAEAHANLGAALHDQGRWAESLASLTKSLAIQPHDAQVLVDAANATKALGRAREAVALYEQALQSNPRSIEAHNNLGNAFLELGQLDAAAGCYGRALGVAPNDAQIHCNLSNAYRRLGRLDEALASCRRAIALDTHLSVAHNTLGLILAALGQLEQAAASYRQALKLNGSDIEALNNLGNVLRDLREPGEAAACYSWSVELDPNNAGNHCNLGNALLDLQRIDEAAASFARALALQPDSALAHVSLATARRLQHQADDAEKHCRAALLIDPNFGEALSLQGELHADRGRFYEAEKMFRQVIAINPQSPFAFFSIAAHRKMSGDDAAWLGGVQALLARRLPLRHEINLRYALGKYFDDIGQYDAAFDSYRLANELTKSHGSPYDRQKMTERVAEIILSFEAAFMRQAHNAAPGSEMAVFIVGMPRSGTSLTEQILASHPAVFGAGELTFWDRAFAAYESQGLKDHRGAGLVPGMARAYLDRLGELSAGAQRVIDKLPGNFMNLGLIHAALPGAKIIHMQRHPIDTCLSIYFQNFLHMGHYAHDLEDLAHFYGEYLRIIAHWRAMLPATQLLEIPYEALIEDQEGWTRQMLEFIGLPWDSKCLDFHLTNRVILTTSKWQVRQKIHAASAGRWSNYQKFVGPLLPLMQQATHQARAPGSAGFSLP